MIGCLRTHVKQPIIALYFEFENELKFYNLEAWQACANAQTGQNLFCLYSQSMDVDEDSGQNFDLSPARYVSIGFILSSAERGFFILFFLEKKHCRS